MLAELRRAIACDLHDEVGSGLGSIAILAELLAEDDLTEEQRRAVAAEIAAASRQLADSLGDIVWSLRREAGTVGDVVARLRERANGLFARSGAAVSIEVAREVADAPLAPDMRRAVQLIAQEALHNAAKHARATRVQVCIVRVGPDLVISVADDGRGFTGVAQSPSGVGLGSMARRAASIGAELSLESKPGKGTRIILRCPNLGTTASTTLEAAH